MTYSWKHHRLPENWQPVNEREHYAPGTIPPPAAQPFAETLRETNKPMKNKLKDKMEDQTKGEINQTPIREGGEVWLPDKYSDEPQPNKHDPLRNGSLVFPPVDADDGKEKKEKAEELEEITLKLPVAVIDRLHDAYLRQLLAVPRRRRAGQSLDHFVSALLNPPIGESAINHLSERQIEDVRDGGSSGENYFDQR